MDGDGADPRSTGRFDIIHTTDRRNHSLDRCADKAANGFGTGAVIDGGDDDQRVLDLGILLDREGGQGLPAGKEDHEVDDDGQDRMDDEDISDRRTVSRLFHRELQQSRSLTLV